MEEQRFYFKDVLFIVLGSCIYAFGLVTFNIANDLAEGGVTGITLILRALFHFNPAYTTLLINIPLLLINYFSFRRIFIMNTQILGLHHVTAMTSSAEKIYHFFTDILGLRLIKKTVNQDDIETYHLFFADDAGSPGTDMTFFDFPGLPKGTKGTNTISRTSFRVKDDAALDYWVSRFNEYAIDPSIHLERLFHVCSHSFLQRFLLRHGNTHGRGNFYFAQIGGTTLWCATQNGNIV